MAKSLKVSDAVHSDAKQRANAAGMKLQRFVELAIQKFRPRIVQAQEPSDARGRKRVAG